MWIEIVAKKTVLLDHGPASPVLRRFFATKRRRTDCPESSGNYAEVSSSSSGAQGFLLLNASPSDAIFGQLEDVINREFIL